MEKRTLIIHVTQSFGGVASVIGNLIEYQKKIGYKVGVMYPKTIDKKVKESFSDIDYYFILNNLKIKGLNQLLGFPLYREYKKILKKHEEYNVVFHVHGPSPIGIIRRISKVPIICTIHGVNAANKYISNYFSNIIIKKLYNTDKIIIGVSDHTTSYYNNILNDTYIKTILNGSTIMKSPPIYKPTKFSIGFVAYLNNFKGWRYVYEAYEMLPKEIKDEIELVFAGIASDEVEKEMISLVKKSKGTIKYLGNVKYASNHLIPYLNLLILPSISEGLSMSLIEAIGNGVPILSTNVGGTPEILKEGINGLFIKRNAESIMLSIVELYNNNKLYNNMKKNSLKLFKEKYHSDIMNENYIYEYKNIIKNMKGKDD